VQRVKDEVLRSMATFTTPHKPSVLSKRGHLYNPTQTIKYLASMATLTTHTNHQVLSKHGHLHNPTQTIKYLASMATIKPIFPLNTWMAAVRVKKMMCVACRVTFAHPHKPTYPSNVHQTGVRKKYKLLSTWRQLSTPTKPIFQ